MQVQCPHCSQHLFNTPEIAGQIVACPHCSKKLTMPAMAPPKPASPNPYSDAPQVNPYASPTGTPQIHTQSAPGGMPHRHVKDYLVESILCLVFCGGVIAIPAIVYAADVKSRLSRGDYHGAVRASENAKKWCIISVCIAVFCNLGVVILIVMGEM
jgi:hypothetical protein